MVEEVQTPTGSAKGTSDADETSITKETLAEAAGAGKPEPTAEEKATQEKATQEKATKEKEAEAAAAAEAKKKEEAAAAPPPKKPEFSLKIPEDSLLHEEAIERAASFAKEQGLSNEQAQKLLDRESAAITDYIERVKNEASSEWMELSKADSEVGGDNLDKSVEISKRVIDKYGSQKFKDALVETGLGNHPELLRIFTKIGKAMDEDKLILPSGHASDAPKQKTPEEVFYPTTEKKE